MDTTDKPCAKHAPAYNETCADCLFSLLAIERATNRALETERDAAVADHLRVRDECFAVMAAEAEQRGRAEKAERERDDHRTAEATAWQQREEAESRALAAEAEAKRITADALAAYRKQYDCEDEATPTDLIRRALESFAYEHERFEARGGEIDKLGDEVKRLRERYAVDKEAEYGLDALIAYVRRRMAEVAAEGGMYDNGFICVDEAEEVFEVDAESFVELADRRAAAEAEVKRLREALIAVTDQQGIDHDEGCPEDDTCECHLVAQVNAALHQGDDHE